MSVERDPEARVSRAMDPSEEGMTVVQRIVERPAAVPSRVVVVVDGSAGLATEASDLARSLARREVDAVVVAGDQVEESAAAALASRRWLGGTDNVPALARAWDRAAAQPGAVILWIHAPQPVLLSPAAPLRQRWERRPDGPRLVALAAGRGPNRILEQLDGIAAISSLPRRGSLAEDLDRLFERWSRGEPGRIALRERVPADAAPAAGPETSRHLVRLWARDEAARLATWPATRPEAVALAVAHQIVTPASGAVVLETARQYQENGLEPAAPGDVPTVPEPETWALLIVASALVASMRRRRQEGLPWTAA